MMLLKIYKSKAKGQLQVNLPKKLVVKANHGKVPSFMIVKGVRYLTGKGKVVR